jgi:hypothetical protein
MRTEPRGRKVRPITDVTSTALGKEEMAIYLEAIRNNEISAARQQVLNKQVYAAVTE